MSKKTGIFKSYAVYDLILIAMLCALSIAIKTIAGALVRMITGSLGIPGRALAGGFYMMWLPLANCPDGGGGGAALIVAAVQTIVMITSGAPGSHGVWTILSYMLPAVPVEIVFFFNKKGYNILHFVLGTALSNIVGTFAANVLFFRLSFFPLMFTLLGAAMSGAIGGVIANFAFAMAKKTGLLKLKRVRQSPEPSPFPLRTHKAPTRYPRRIPKEPKRWEVCGKLRKKPRRITPMRKQQVAYNYSLYSLGGGARPVRHATLNPSFSR